MYGFRHSSRRILDRALVNLGSGNHVSIISVLGIYLDRILPETAQRISPSAKNIAGGTFFLNFLTIMRGGSLFPPFLRMMKLDMRKAIATSLFATVFTAVGGAIVFYSRGNIMLLPALWVIVGSIIGARIGSLVSLKTKPAWLEVGLSVLIVAFHLWCSSKRCGDDG